MKAMDILKMMALPMAAATMMLAVSCTREKLADPQDGVKVHSIPVSVDVTRTEADPSTKAVFNTETRKLSFSEGDKLSVTGTHETAGTFSGTLDYSGSGKFSGKIFTENEFTGTATDLLSTANPVEATLVEHPKQMQQKSGEHQWLTATDGHATATVLHHLSFLLYLCHQRFRRPFVPTQFQSHRRALFSATSAAHTIRGMVGDAILVVGKGMMRACAHAGLAPQTFAVFVKQLSLAAPTIRIMAPHAAQRTSLDEERGADAWSVVDGIALDVEYQRRVVHTHLTSLRSLSVL